MKKYLIPLTVLLLGFYACKQELPIIEEPEVPVVNPPDTVEESGFTYIFDIEKVPTLYIDISTSEWNTFLSNFDKNSYNEEYIHADLIFRKEQKSDTLKNIGFRLRGNTSRRRPEGSTGQTHNSVNPDWHHAHFSLNLNKYVKGQKLRGVEKINLKWFKDDPNYVREVYCYDLFERFGVWTSPQSSYCRLYLRIKEDNKWIYYGVHQLLEPVDEDYLKNRIFGFKDMTGNLWKANWGADLVNTDQSRMGVETVTLTSTYRPVYDLKSNEENLNSAKTQLAAFITNFNAKQGDGFKTWLNNAMDVPLFLKTYAVSVMCGMWDDYWNNSNNFYFYFNAAGKFYFIPYDYDNTLGTSLLMDDSGKQDLLNWGKSTNPLVKKIIDIPEYKALYVGYLNELCRADQDLFYSAKSIARITKWQNMVRSFVSNDTGEDMAIYDSPPFWGNCSHYRLISGTNNYFTIRAQHLPN